MPSWLKNLLSRSASAGPFPAETPLEAVRYVVVDTELTSLDSQSNRILSIGAVTMDGSKIRMGQQFYRIVNPGIDVPAETVIIHGLRPVDVVEGGSPSQTVADFLKFAEGAVLVGHFVGIDLAALKKELASACARLEEPALCTARIQRWLDLRRSAYQEDRGHHVESVDLASLAKRYGMEVREAHHALYDAFLTARLWQRLMHQLGSYGVKTLSEALRIGKPERR
jgi:DNA polymerase-3 subunit epsilon